MVYQYFSHLFSRILPFPYLLCKSSSFSIFVLSISDASSSSSSTSCLIVQLHFIFEFSNFQCTSYHNRKKCDRADGKSSIHSLGIVSQVVYQSHVAYFNLTVLLYIEKLPSISNQFSSVIYELFSVYWRHTI